MAHSHKTKAEVIECAVWFGDCDKQPSNDYSRSNYPHGTQADDK